jgi:hypothetical protein
VQSIAYVSLPERIDDQNREVLHSAANIRPASSRENPGALVSGYFHDLPAFGRPVLLPF